MLICAYAVPLPILIHPLLIVDRIRACGFHRLAVFRLNHTRKHMCVCCHAVSTMFVIYKSVCYSFMVVIQI